jgi:hypothetical protein
MAMESKERSGAAPPAMTAFEQKRAALEGRTVNAAVAPKVYDVYLKLEGVANTDVQVGDFMEKLKRSALFKDVNLIYTEELKQTAASQGNNRASAKDEILRKFQVELMLNPNAEVVNPANPNTKTKVEMAGSKPAPTPSATGGTASVGGN